MTNILTVLIIVAIIYWIKTIISRKQKELDDKELLHREQFLKESQLLLDTTGTKTDNENKMVPVSSDNNFITQISEYFKAKGYVITESSKTEGIDLIGIKENELALIRCESSLKEIKEAHLKEFIADCTIYTDKHPMLKHKEIRRYYATNRAVSEEGHAFARNHPSTLQLLEH